MSRRISILIFLLGPSLMLQGQVTSAWGQIGGSYIRQGDQGFPPAEEFTLRLAVAFDVKELLSFGLKTHGIFYLGIPGEWQRMWLAGPFGRIGVSPFDRSRLYVESGLYLGNYCTCGNGPSGSNYRDDGLLYYSFGGGFEYRVSEAVFADIGIMAHNIANRPRPHFGYNVYFIGVLMRVGR
ncbi:MAG: hypothetical protein AAF804_18755 [Bacteroidota bacterium]